MTRMVMVRIFLMILVLSLLSACVTTPTPTPQVALEHPVPPGRDLIAEVRAAADGVVDGFDVTPLHDPTIADLRDRAIWLESERDFVQADAVLEQALTLTPDNPDLLQWRAELALALGRFDDAVRFANASWEAGPRLGSLCRRNWTAIQLAREFTNYPHAAEVASAQMARCTVEPPVRM